MPFGHFCGGVSRLCPNHIPVTTNGLPPQNMSLLRKVFTEPRHTHPRPRPLGPGLDTGRALPTRGTVVSFLGWDSRLGLPFPRGDSGSRRRGHTYCLFIVLGTRQMRGIFDSACGDKSRPVSAPRTACFNSGVLLLLLLVKTGCRCRPGGASGRESIEVNNWFISGAGSGWGGGRRCGVLR